MKIASIRAPFSSFNPTAIIFFWPIFIAEPYFLDSINFIFKSCEKLLNRSTSLNVLKSDFHFSVRTIHSTSDRTSLISYSSNISFSSPMTDDLPSFARKMIRLLDMQTGTPVGIYLEPDNTLNLDHVRLMYPNATTVKCLFPDQNVPCL